VHQAYGVPIHSVRQRRVDLMGGGEFRETVIGERRLDELLTYIRGSVADMLALLDDTENNLASEDRFAKVVRREVCGRCSFARVCKPELPGLAQ
jgi:hypothetical protein